MTRYFAHKAWLGGMGLVTGLFGMALGRGWLVWIAVAFLAVAFILRFAERKAHNS